MSKNQTLVTLSWLRDERSIYFSSPQQSLPFKKNYYAAFWRGQCFLPYTHWHTKETCSTKPHPGTHPQPTASPEALRQLSAWRLPREPAGTGMPGLFILHAPCLLPTQALISWSERATAGRAAACRRSPTTGSCQHLMRALVAKPSRTNSQTIQLHFSTEPTLELD